jgi:hypothetical protein
LVAVTVAAVHVEVMFVVADTTAFGVLVKYCSSKLMV